MATDMDEFYPFATGAGSNVSEEEWRDMAEDWLATGVVAGEDSELAVVQHAAGAAASIDVSTGEVRIVGHVGIVSAVKTLGIAANASGNPRIDLIVARAVFTAGNKAIVLDVLQGAAAAAPVEPAVTQNLTSMWEEPLAAIDVAAGFVTIVTANIRDRRSMTRMVRQLITKEPVRVATTAALAASTVTDNNRVANANGALAAIDGVTLVAPDRLLDKDHATGSARGIWRVVDPGSATRPWRMERPRDFDASADVRGGLTVRVNEGTTLADTGWLLTTNNPIVLGTTGLTFAQSPSPTLTAEGFRAYRTTNQALLANTWTTIVFDSEVRDEGADYNPATGEWTVPSTGWYDVGGSVAFSALADGERYSAALYVNGAANSRIGGYHAAGVAGTFLTGGSVPLYLALNDVVTLRALRSNAGNAAGGGSDEIYFTAKRRSVAP